MHNIEPFYRWLQLYDPALDPQSPFDGKEYNYDLYSDTIYGYYIDPAWDFMGSDTLYMKILYVDYDINFAVIEFIGEWNDAIENDIMQLKRNIIDVMVANGIDKYILIGENVFNFHGSDDCYYEDWFEDVENGWIVAVNFREFIYQEWEKFNLDSYINFGGNLDVDNWRTLSPYQFYEKIENMISRRIGSYN